MYEVNHIKSVRKNRGLTQEQLAKKAGISRSFLTNLENLKTSADIKYFYKIASALNVKISQILNEAPKPSNHISGIGTVIEYDPTDTIPLLTSIKCAEGINWIDSYPVGEGMDKVMRYGVKGEKVFAVRVEGDSMEPDLKEGDILIINPDKAFTDVKGGIGVIKRDDKCWIRKVYRRADNLILEPSNKAYEADIVPYTGTTIFKIVKMVRDW